MFAYVYGGLARKEENLIDWMHRIGLGHSAISAFMYLSTLPLSELLQLKTLKRSFYKSVGASKWPFSEE